MKPKKQIPKMLPNEVLRQLKKMKTIPSLFLLQVFYWLLNQIDFLHFEHTDADYYVIPVRKQGVITFPSKRVRVENGMLVVAEGSFELTGIVCMVREENGVFLYFEKGDSKLITASIRELDDALKGFGFFSPKNNSVINISFITSIDKGKRGFVHLKDKNKVEIVRELKAKLLKLYNEHQQRV